LCSFAIGFWRLFRPSNVPSRDGNAYCLAGELARRFLQENTASKLAGYKGDAIRFGVLAMHLYNPSPTAMVSYVRPGVYL
jgi:hypothetical protein